MFDAVPITAFFVSVIEAVAVERRLESRCRTDEKERISDGMVLADSARNIAVIA